MSGADGADAAFSKQLGHELARDRFELIVELVDLAAEMQRIRTAIRRTTAAATAVSPLRSRVFKASFACLFAREAAEAAAERLGGGHDRGLKLVQRGRAGSDSTLAFHQEEPEVVTDTATTRPGKPLP